MHRKSVAVTRSTAFPPWHQTGGPRRRGPDARVYPDTPAIQADKEKMETQAVQERSWRNTHHSG